MEQVLVVPNELVQEHLRETGFIAGDLAKLEAILVGAHYLPREQAEGNPRFRQLIPYVVILYRGRIFAMQRLKAQSESRLHLKLSCGVGGHINPCDGHIGLEIITRAAAREVAEEVFVESFAPSSLVFYGFINDLSNSVSRDHLGCLYVLEVRQAVAVRESDKMTGFFMDIEELKARLNDLETWSQLVLPELENSLV